MTSTTKTTKKTAAAPDADATKLAYQELLKRQRAQMARNLLKRRRRKSNQ